MGREKYGEINKQLTIQSTPHQLSTMVEQCYGRGTYGCQWNESPVFIDDVTTDRSSRINSEVFRTILSVHIQPNATKLIGCRWIMTLNSGLVINRYLFVYVAENRYLFTAILLFLTMITTPLNRTNHFIYNNHSLLEYKTKQQYKY